MATNFPTSLDTFTNPNSGNTLDSPSHSVQHSDINDAVEAIEAKLGVGSSTAGSATAGYALVNTSGGTTAYSLLGVTGLSSGTAVANTVLTADGSSGVTFAPTAQGLTLLNTISFSAQSAVSLPDNTFTSTYDNYLVKVNFTAASLDLGLTLRMRASGSDFTSAAYDKAGTINAANSATVSGQGANGQTSWAIADVHATYPTYSQVEVTFRNPNTTNAFKAGLSSATFVSPSDNVGRALFLGLAVSSATQFDSASFIASTGNFSGNYSVYGFNK